MRSKHQTLPPRVVFPTRATVTQREILDELRVSRQTLFNWRSSGFPKPVRKEGRVNFYSTAEICSYLRAYGSDVRLV